MIKKILVLFCAMFILVGFTAPKVLAEGEEPTKEEAMEQLAPPTQDFDFGEWIQSYFTPEMITAMISIFTALGAVLKVCSSLHELAKKHSMSSEEIYNNVMKAVESGIDGKTKEALNDMILPLQANIKEISPVLQTFAKILALSQENTPQSRIAILELIQTLGQVDTTIVENAKTVVTEEVKTDEKEKNKKVEKLEKISKKNKPVE